MKKPIDTILSVVSALGWCAALSMGYGCSGEPGEYGDEDAEIGQAEQGFITSVTQGTGTRLLTGLQVSGSGSGALTGTCITSMPAGTACAIPVTRAPRVQTLKGACSSQQFNEMNSRLDGAIGDINAFTGLSISRDQGGSAHNMIVTCSTAATANNNGMSQYVLRSVAGLGVQLTQPLILARMHKMHQALVEYRIAALDARGATSLEDSRLRKHGAFFALMPLAGEGGNGADGTYNSQSISPIVANRTIMSVGAKCRANTFNAEASPTQYVLSNFSFCVNN